MDQNHILACLSKGLPITECILRPGKTLVGRAGECGILIPNLTISRRHAMITVSDRVTVTDLRSCNGTFIDDKPVKSGVVRFGQIVRFGSVSFRLTTGSGCEEELHWEVSTFKSPITRDPLSAEETIHSLSSAQKRVFHLLVKGLRENDVAKQLDLSVHTVHTHTREIYRQFDVHSRAELLSRLIPDV
ncbi:MAG: FHA domain-containing protein [Planctomycetaceae bacterium]